MVEIFDIKRGRAAGLEPPLSEQAYSRVRADILGGAIQPNERLKIDALQTRYALSNTPLREALNRLTAEGLVIADERRGFRAAPVSLADFENLTRYRLVIEEGALTESIVRGDDQWEAQLVASYHLLQVGHRSGERNLDEHWSRAHKSFHIALLAGCGSSKLLGACATALDEAERYRCLSSRSSAHAPRHDEHQLILNAALERDSRLAAALLRKHIMRTAENVMSILSREEAQDGTA